MRDSFYRKASYLFVFVHVKFGDSIDWKTFHPERFQSWRIAHVYLLSSSVFETLSS